MSSPKLLHTPPPTPPTHRVAAIDDDDGCASAQRLELLNMPVFWTIQARAATRAIALAEQLGRETEQALIGTGPCRGVLEVTLDHLNELLGP